MRASCTTQHPPLGGMHGPQGSRGGRSRAAVGHPLVVTLHPPNALTALGGTRRRPGLGGASYRLPRAAAAAGTDERQQPPPPPSGKGSPGEAVAKAASPAEVLAACAGLPVPG